MLNVYKYSLQSIENDEFWQVFPKNVDLWRQSNPLAIIEPILHDNFALFSFATQQNLTMIRVIISATMLDCLASDYSHVFFDADDVPPPELWVDYLADQDCLIAVISPMFKPMVGDIIENYSKSKSIMWYHADKTIF